MNRPKILLGVTGSIAAYKACFLLRLLQEKNAIVQVVMTHSATSFVSPLTFAALSGMAVHLDFEKNKQWDNHVLLAQWADAFILAPTSANTLGKIAHGICDNLLLAVYFSLSCPVFIAPAMDEPMWLHPSLQENSAKIQTYPKHTLLPVGQGKLASGLEGKGRMMEPAEIVNHMQNALNW